MLSTVMSNHVTPSYNQKEAVKPESHEHEEGDINLIELWITFDFPRIAAGAVTGIFAGLVAWTFAGVIAASAGLEFWYPFKIAATPLLGNSAMNFGMSGAVFVGLTVHCGLCAVLGMVFSHFVKTNKLVPLLGAGFMWGTFSWVFIQNLFVRSFLDVRTADIPSGIAFFVLLVFGFSLASIRIFDGIFCSCKKQ